MVCVEALLHVAAISLAAARRWGYKYSTSGVLRDEVKMQNEPASSKMFFLNSQVNP